MKYWTLALLLASTALAQSNAQSHIQWTLSSGVTKAPPGNGSLGVTLTELADTLVTDVMG